VEGRRQGLCRGHVQVAARRCALALDRCCGLAVTSAPLPSAANAEFVRAQGAGVVYDYTKPEEMASIPAASFDVVYDTVGG
jgi:hypothetical protein